MKNPLVITIILIILAVGGYLLYKRKSKKPDTLKRLDPGNFRLDPGNFAQPQMPQVQPETLWPNTPNSSEAMSDSLSELAPELKPLIVTLPAPEPQVIDPIILPQITMVPVNKPAKPLPSPIELEEEPLELQTMELNDLAALSIYM